MSTHLSMAGCCCSVGQLKKISMVFEWRGWLPLISGSAVTPYTRWPYKYRTLSFDWQNTPFGGSTSSGTYSLTHDLATGITIATVTGTPYTFNTTGRPSGFGNFPWPSWAVFPDWSAPTSSVHTSHGVSSFTDIDATSMYYEYTAADTLNDGYVDLTLSDPYSDADLLTEMQSLMDTDDLANLTTPDPALPWPSAPANVIVRKIGRYHQWDDISSGTSVGDNGWDSGEASYYSDRATYFQSFDPAAMSGLPLPSYITSNWVTSLPTPRLLYNDVLPSPSTPSSLVGDVVSQATIGYLGSNATGASAGSTTLIKSHLRQVFKPDSYCYNNHKIGFTVATSGSITADACAIVSLSDNDVHAFDYDASIDPTDTGSPFYYHAQGTIKKDYVLTGGGCPCV